AAAKKAETDTLVKMFNDYYQEAFVDPRKWGDGTFKDLKAHFASDVQPSFVKDINSLTIGEARTELRRVDLDVNTLAVTVYFDSHVRPSYAVVVARFNAH